MEMQEFSREMRETGECRTISTRYTDQGMIVTIVFADSSQLPESYMFEWEDE